MTNIQKLITDMCMWNRIVATDRTKLVAAREDELSEDTIDTLQNALIESKDFLMSVEIQAVKLGLIERLDAYTHITEADLEDSQ